MGAAGAARNRSVTLLTTVIEESSTTTAATARSIDHANNPKTDAVARHTTDVVACRFLRGSSHSLVVERLWHHRSPPHILFAAPSSPSITRSEKTSIRSTYRCLQVFNGTNDYPTRRPTDKKIGEFSNCHIVYSGIDFQKLQ
uniref:Uncharacterized protein n=1 Tax=Oryza glumipatula TaxID=40148 RepID=A0A0E0AAJ4_9ORYZ